MTCVTPRLPADPWIHPFARLRFAFSVAQFVVIMSVTSVLSFAKHNASVLNRIYQRLVSSAIMFYCLSIVFVSEAHMGRYLGFDSEYNSHATIIILFCSCLGGILALLDINFDYQMLTYFTIINGVCHPSLLI